MPNVGKYLKKESLSYIFDGSAKRQINLIKKIRQYLAKLKSHIEFPLTQHIFSQVHILQILLHIFSRRQLNVHHIMLCNSQKNNSNNLDTYQYVNTYIIYKAEFYYLLFLFIHCYVTTPKYNCLKQHSFNYLTVAAGQEAGHDLAEFSVSGSLIGYSQDVSQSCCLISRLKFGENLLSSSFKYLWAGFSSL